MTMRVDERTRRQSHARSAAASILGQPRVARRFAVPEDAVLRRSPRRRARQPASGPFIPEAATRGLSRRRVAGAILLAQIGVLAALLVLPVFRASHIELRGNRLLTRAQLLAAAGISPRQSLFTLDGDAVRARLQALPWVRSAGVETDLPDTVRITVVEWTPSLRLQRGTHALLVADDGATLDMTARGLTVPSLPLLVDERGGTSATAPLDPDLVRTLAVTAQRFPAVFHTAVTSFEWNAEGVLSIVTAAGWRAVLGHMDTTAQIDGIPAELTALASLAQRVDLAKPRFGYVDLEDPAAPAVGGHPASPGAAPPEPPASAAPSPAPSASAVAQATATPRPSAAATPTPTPRPTPLQVRVPPPTPAPTHH